MSVFDRLQQRLESAGVEFQITRHAPVFTSEEAAAIRGVSLATGAKALIVKADDRFLMLVFPADRKLDSKKARKSLGVKSIRFASRDEVEALTTLQPGSIPPFGSLFGLPSIVDPTLSHNPTINFNAGDHSISIAIAYVDWEGVERPHVLEIT